jgi:NitT/TauT family transport system permease protein
VVRGAAGVVVVLGAFEVLGRAGLVSRTYLPPSSEVLWRALRLGVDAEFLAAVGATLTAWALGLLLAVAVGTSLGAVLGTLPGVRAAAAIVVEFLRPIPSVALIPLAALLLGSGLSMKVALIAYAAVWPLLYNTIYGLGETDPLAKETLRSFGFGPWSVVWRVSLPSAAPYIATGVRLAASIALILAVSIEILSGRGSGIGIYAAAAQTGTGTADVVLACTAWAGVLGLVINTVLVRLERRVLAWHHVAAGAA